MKALPDNRTVSPPCQAFLRTFENGELTRDKVYSFSALYRVKELGLVELARDGTTNSQIVYRLTEAGRKYVSQS